jgi:hypothetical protein
MTKPQDSHPANCRKSKSNKGLPDNPIHQETPIDPPGIHDTCQTDPDLAQINTAWPTLPDAVRASIMMLVQAASGKMGRMS